MCEISQPYTARVLSAQISLIVACITGVIAYRLAVYASFASIIGNHEGETGSHENRTMLVGGFITPQLATSVTASCINFVIIMILNFFYEKVAIWITDLGIGFDLAHKSGKKRKDLLSDLLTDDLLCFLQKYQKLTWNMRTGWSRRCFCSSLSTTTPPASMWPSSKANLWVIRVTTRTCSANGRNLGMRRWVLKCRIDALFLFVQNWDAFL